MRRLFSILIVMPLVSVGCGTTSKAPEEKSATVITVDGLVRVPTDARGDLFLRIDHGIGGYDAIAVAPSFVNYLRTSDRLDPDDEEVYLVSLEQSIIDVANAANVEIVNELGNCVIKVGAGFLNVDLAHSDRDEVLGEMTLVIEYQDSMSGQSLLRYAVDERVMREHDGTSREEQVRKSFDQMVAEVDIITALRKATSVPSSPRPGCKGSLINAGRPAAAK